MGTSLSGTTHHPASVKSDPEKLRAWQQRSRKPLKRSGFGPRIASKARKPKKLARQRLDTVGKLKKTLWNLCREIIFKQYGNICYCCGALDLVGSNRHLGHFIPSSVSSAELRYSLDNLRPSCYRCNIHLSGNWPAYEAHLRRDGIDVEALKQRNYDTKGKQYDRLFYQSKIDEYSKFLLSLSGPEVVL